MRIIISPAKKMNADTDSLPARDLPAFLEQTEELCRELQSKSPEELQKLWKCNDQIAALNVERLRNMDLHRNLTPAVLAYEGIQYQYMAPNVFTNREYDYIQEHLRILSGFYGVLRPFDGVTPYRLEMQAKLEICDAKDLYNYWNNKLAEHIFGETDCIINLASKEYARCIEKYLTADDTYITIVFCEKAGDKLVTKGTYAKMARGEMVRYMAENCIENPMEIKHFNRLGYIFRDDLSSDTYYVFERIQ